MSCTKPFMTTPLSVPISRAGVRPFSQRNALAGSKTGAFYANSFAQLIMIEESEQNDDRNRHA